jgi:tetratricopeptide (TPR) repeat protein
VVLLVVAVTLQVTRDRIAPPPPDVAPQLWMQSPAAARRIMLSFTDLGADLYWIRAVIHFGGERRSASTAPRFTLLYPLLDMATTLDPHFDVAARLGAIFLSEGHPGGAGRTDQALQLLEKGLAAEPDRWQYRHDIGFVHYWWLKDYPEAARQFELASRMPRAPEWLQTMAAVTLARGGDRDAARKLWTEMLAATDMEWVRRAAEYGLLQLRALDEIDELTRWAAAVAATTGTPPTSWNDLVAQRALAGEPVDPTGVPYVLGRDGTVTLGEASGLKPLPVLEAHR